MLLEYVYLLPNFTTTGGVAECMLGSKEVEGTGRKAGPHIQHSDSGELARGIHLLESTVDHLALLCGALHFVVWVGPFTFHARA